MLSEQLFSVGERKAAVTYKVTVHGIPGPEPFTVFSVSAGTTAAQLLHQVSFLLNCRLFIPRIHTDILLDLCLPVLLTHRVVVVHSSQQGVLLEMYCCGINYAANTQHGIFPILTSENVFIILEHISY